jgi:hypothetical protein
MALALSVAACATSGTLRTARRAELQQDYDRAVVEYSQALQLRVRDKAIWIGRST